MAPSTLPSLLSTLIKLLISFLKNVLQFSNRFHITLKNKANSPVEHICLLFSTCNSTPQYSSETSTATTRNRIQEGNPVDYVSHEQEEEQTLTQSISAMLLYWSENQEKKKPESGALWATESHGVQGQQCKWGEGGRWRSPMKLGVV